MSYNIKNCVFHMDTPEVNKNLELLAHAAIENAKAIQEIAKHISNSNTAIKIVGKNG